MIDPLEGVRSFLRADSDVAQLSGDRVFVAELPRDEVEEMPRKAVLLKPAGGPGGGAYLDFAKVRVDVDCYGETPKEAWLLHLAVRTALKNMRRTVVKGVLLHSADVSADGSSGRDPETDWPVTVATYLVSVSEVAVDAA